MNSNRSNDKKIITGVGAALMAGLLLLAACGPEAAPTPNSTTNTVVPGTGSTPTDVRGVIAEPTISTDSPLTTPGPTETSGASRVETPATDGTTQPPAAMETPGMTNTPGSTTTPEAVTEGNSYRVTMNAQNGSNEAGSATITDLGNGMVNVVLDITGPDSTDPQPAHIHKGTCANLDPSPAYPLSSAVGGKSVTEIEVDFADLTASEFAINVHKSAAEASVYVSCGDISRSAVESPEGADGAATPDVQESPTPGSS